MCALQGLHQGATVDLVAVWSGTSKVLILCTSPLLLVVVLFAWTFWPLSSLFSPLCVCELVLKMVSRHCYHQSLCTCTEIELR